MHIGIGLLDITRDDLTHQGLETLMGTRYLHAYIAAH